MGVLCCCCCCCCCCDDDDGGDTEGCCWFGVCCCAVRSHDRDRPWLSALLACSTSGRNSSNTVWRLSHKILCPSAVRRSNWTRPIPSPLNRPKQQDTLCCVSIWQNSTIKTDYNAVIKEDTSAGIYLEKNSLNQPSEDCHVDHWRLRMHPEGYFLDLRSEMRSYEWNVPCLKEKFPS